LPRHQTPNRKVNLSKLSWKCDQRVLTVYVLTDATVSLALCGLNVLVLVKYPSTSHHSIRCNEATFRRFWIGLFQTRCRLRLNRKSLHWELPHPWQVHRPFPVLIMRRGPLRRVISRRPPTRVFVQWNRGPKVHGAREWQRSRATTSRIPAKPGILVEVKVRASPRSSLAPPTGHRQGSWHSRPDWQQLRDSHKRVRSTDAEICPFFSLSSTTPVDCGP
jgi:hypothetical protein